MVCLFVFVNWKVSVGRDKLSRYPGLGKGQVSGTCLARGPGRILAEMKRRFFVCVFVCLFTF